MRLLLNTLGWLFAILLALSVGLVALLLLDDQPLVAETPAISPQERAWARDWVQQHKPQQQQTQDLVRLQLTERELNVVTNELLRKLGQGRAQIRLDAGRAEVALSLRIPLEDIERYLDLEVELAEAEGLPMIAAARLAGVPVPGALARALAERALTAVDRTGLVEEVSFAADQVNIAYSWRPDMLERIGSGLVDNADLELALAYQARLAEITDSLPAGRPVALADLLTELFARAQREPLGEDPVAEHRGLILALGAYVNEQVIRRPADSAETLRQPRYRPVLLRGRLDLSQHFMASAVLAVQGDQALSGLVGWFKELVDSDGGSGFSFADMAANRAGIRFAAAATGEPDTARHIQQIACRGLRDDDFMPPLDGLPEGMRGAEFARRFGAPGSPAYEQLIAQIDQRIAERPLYRGTST